MLQLLHFKLLLLKGPKFRLAPAKTFTKSTKNSLAEMQRFFLRIKWRMRWWRCATGHGPYAVYPNLDSKECIFFLERGQRVIYSSFHSTLDSGTMMKSKVELNRFQINRAVFFGFSSNFAQAWSQNMPNTLEELGWNLLIHLCRRSSGCTLAASQISRASFSSCQS